MREFVRKDSKTGPIVQVFTFDEMKGFADAESTWKGQPVVSVDGRVDISGLLLCKNELLFYRPVDESSWIELKKYLETDYLEVKPVDNGIIRQFETGATRDTAEDKLDYEGFLSPTVLRRYAEYLHKHRAQSDGSLRASDNWQKGIPFDVYMKSMFRHFMEVWEMHRNPGHPDEDAEEALCGVMFNAMGYLHEYLKDVKKRETNE